ncbi:MAG TPA: hypothetical protein VGH36_04465 [Acetobacteraceae bacterium]|jgi:hypothetical protein
MGAPRHSPAEIAKAQATVALIQRKVDKLLLPLAREMQIMRWAPDYREILWVAVMLEAQKRAAEAHALIADRSEA